MEEKRQHGPAEMRMVAEPNQKRKKNDCSKCTIMQYFSGLLLNPDKTKLVIFGSRQMTANIT